MSLLNPLFLLGLAAIAAPIIVHLVRSAQARRVEFASLMFVRRIPQRTIRRKRLHNLLLLALRCLALLFLVLAFTRPYFNTPRAVEAGQGDRASVILLDTSFSMRYGQRFEQAKARARALVSEARGGDRLALVSFGEGFEIISRFTNETTKLPALIEALKAGFGGTDYAQALRGAEELFQEVPGAGERRIYLISDFQASGWNPAETSFRLSQDIKLVPLDVGETAAPNIAVTELGVQPTIYQQKYPDKLAVRVANFSDDPAESVRVEFKINDQVIEKRETRIEARGSQVIELTGFNLSPGANRCQIEVSGDSFLLDNRFYFTLRREEQAKVLIIETASRGRSESLYLQHALTTGEDLPFASSVKTSGSVNPAEISQYRAIILNDAGNLNPALVSALTKFVEQGGGLIIAAGPHLGKDELNNALKALSPVTLNEVVRLRSDYVAMSEIKADHPIFEVFQQSGRLAVARVFAYHRSTPHEKASVLARFEDGSPALLEQAFGGGKVLLFTSTLDASWNDLPLTPLYLPLVQQTVRYLSEQKSKAWHPLGQTFIVPVAKDGTPPAVDAPSGERITERVLTATGELIINAREPGFYRLRYPDHSEFAAVDLESKESDFSKLNVEEFMAAITGSGPKPAQAAAANEKLSFEEIEARQRIWWSLLVTALILFVAEAVLARRTKMAKVIG